MERAAEVAPSGERRGARLALALGLLVVLAAGVFRVHNLDTPLHDLTGGWILEHGQVPATNVLSRIHHDYPSVHDKWAFQVLTHLLLEAFGPGGLIVLRVLLLLVLFGTLAASARGLGATPAATLLCFCLALVAARTRFLIRPDLLSLVLLVLWLHVGLVARPDGRRVLRLLLPFQLIWVNVHGYFLLGWLVPLALAVGHRLMGPSRRGAARRWLGVSVVLCLACLANPAGWRGWWHPFSILADLSAHLEFYRSVIEEFAPTFAADPRQPLDRLACVILGVLALGLLIPRALAAWRAARRRADGSRSALPEAGLLSRGLGGVIVPAFVVLIMFALMLPSLRRNMAPFALVAAAPTAAAIPTRVARSLSLLVLAACLSLLVMAGELSNFTSIHDGLQRRAGWGRSALAYPDAGIGFIARELPRAEVFTAFRYGSSFSAARWPSQVASTNGNTHGYPTAWLQQVMGATADTDPMAFARLVHAQGFDAALIPMACPLAARLMRTSDWRLVFLGRQEAVFVAADSVPADWLAAHDLEPALKRGELPDLPPPEARPPWGADRPTGPRFDAAVLCLAGGLAKPALALARAALARSPRNAAAQGLLGLLLLRDGQPEQARELLERSVRSGREHLLSAQVRRALDALAASEDQRDR